MRKIIPSQSFIKGSFADFKKIPLILKLLIFFCYMCILFLVVAIIPIPGMSYNISNQEVSYIEFWKLGGGPVFIIIGVIFPICGYAFLNKKSWGRYIFISIMGLYSIFEIYTLFTKNYNIESIVSAFIFFLLLAWYLLYKKSVKEYFNSQNI